MWWLYEKGPEQGQTQALRLNAQNLNSVVSSCFERAQYLSLENKHGMHWGTAGAGMFCCYSSIKHCGRQQPRPSF